MDVKWRGALSTLIACAIGVFFLAWNQGWLVLDKPLPSLGAVQADCVDLAQGCHFALAGKTWTIRSNGPISAAHPLTLTLAGAPLQTATASWQMVGMEMGPNVFHFAAPADANGSWQTQTALPFCTQARNDWLLTLMLDGKTVILTTRSR